MTRTIAGLWVAAVLGLAACTGHEAAGLAGGNAPLLASVKATPAADSVRFVLQVTNTGTSPVRLRYPSGQSFDFSVTRDGREVWRWSADRMFTQALRDATLAPGETLQFEAGWRPDAGLPAGEYTVTGELTAEPGARQRTTFRLPA